jgi:hypothetical protein
MALQNLNRDLEAIFKTVDTIGVNIDHFLQNIVMKFLIDLDTAVHN